MINEDKRLLTIKEAAKILRVCERTIWNYLKAGTIRPVRLGAKAGKAGRVLIPMTEIDKIIER